MDRRPDVIALTITNRSCWTNYIPFAMTGNIFDVAGYLLLISN